MNIAKLFLGKPSNAALTHVKSTQSEVTRTWQELRDNVAGLTAGWRTLGIEPGDRILILSSSRVEIIEGILAAFAMGAVAMPVGPTMGRATIVAIVQRMKPRACVFEDVPDPEVIDALRALSCLLITLKPEEASDSGYAGYHSLIEAGSLTESGATLQFPSFADAHPALIIHSSGSTGAPKVIVMGHGAVLRFFEYHDFVWRQYADASDTFDATGALITGLPLSHLAGIGVCLQGLLNGRHAYVMTFFLPHAYLKLMERSRCACMLLIPSLYRALLNDPHLEQMDRSALRCCILAGEACSAELMKKVEAAFGVPAVMAYSMTECLSGFAHSRREIFAGNIKRGSCGRQLFGEVSLRNTDGSVNESFGELWVRNSTVHRCYLDEEMNDARLKNGWFRTGDLFFRDADGDFFHRGRVDDMFICNGKNIYPLEMEMLILQHAGIEAACAAPIIAAHRGTNVPAIVIVASQPLTAREVQDHFRANAPTHTIPQFVLFAKSLPLLGPGKTDRRQAAKMLQEAYDATREPQVV